jgi:hypothetical protein
MFLLELYLKGRQAKLRAWRKRGEEWVSKRNSGAGYSVYHFEDYERAFPSPVFPFKKVATFVLPGIGAVAVLSLIVWGIITAPPKKVDPNNPNDCTTVVKKGDKIGIIAGDFNGSKGTVIDQRKDCSVNLTLDMSTYTLDMCKKIGKGYCDSAKENGAILSIGKSSDIVKL